MNTLESTLLQIGVSNRWLRYAIDTSLTRDVLSDPGYIHSIRLNLYPKCAVYT